MQLATAPTENGIVHHGPTFPALRQEWANIDRLNTFNLFTLLMDKACVSCSLPGVEDQHFPGRAGELGVAD
ncbi:MAG: hypothetical protein ACPGLY_16080 [Rubripirellula sp.]